MRAEVDAERGMSSRTIRRIAVLKGGLSAERDVSLVSGQRCSAALRDEGYETVEVDAGVNLSEELSKINPDAVFNSLHGRWGEDGCVQGLLEWMQLPYTHSGVLASALAMDKAAARLSFINAGLPVAEGKVVEARSLLNFHPMDPPYVVKPINEGSSVGVVIVPAGVNSTVGSYDQSYREVLVEKYVPGRELTVTVMGTTALAITDIRTSSWYDYKAKYSQGGSRHVIPADLPSSIRDACMDIAQTAHSSLGCRALSRADFRWDETRGLDGLVLLEVNTQPGMTPTSLSPEQAQFRGTSFSAMCRFLIEDASCDR